MSLRLQAGRRQLLGWVADITCRHPLLMVISALLVTAVAAVGIANLRLETSLADYLPEDSPVVARFTRAVEHYGSSDHLVVVFRGDEENVEAREVLADAMAKLLEESGLVRSVEYRFGGDTGGKERAPIVDYALFYLDDSGLESLAAMLEPQAIRTRVQNNLEILRSPASLLAKELVRRDPLGLRDLFAERFRQLKGNLNLRFMDGYAFSRDLQLLVMLVKPVEPAQNLAFTENFLRQIDAFALAARGQAIGELGEEALAGVEIGFTGGYPIVSEYNAFLKRDLAWSIVTAFAGVMILFLVAFRRVGSLLYVGVPLVVTLIWTMGFAGMVVGHLNLFTALAAAILMGLAIDFAIHLFNRYVSERDRGHGLDQSIRASVVETGDGVITAALTTIVAFGACTITRIEGLAQLGLICGAGMIFGLVANFVLLPALLKLRGGRRHRGDYKDSSFNFGLSHVAAFVIRYPRAVMLIWGVVTVVFAWGALNARIDTDMRSLRPNSSPVMALQEELSRSIGSSLVYSMILVEAPSEAQAMDLNHVVARRLDDLVARQEVIFFLSLDSILPPPQRQREVLQWLAERRRADSSSLDPERVVRDLGHAFAAEGFRLGPEYETTAAMLRQVLSLDETLTLDGLDDPAVLERASRFMWREDGLTEMVTYVYPAQGQGRRQYKVMDMLETEILGDLDGVHLIGVSVLGRELKRLIRDGALEAAVLTLALVVLLLWSHFRRPFYVALVAVPLLLGELGAFGGMALLGLDLNLVNMGIVPIILGIGIDDGIHIVHRFIDRGEHDVVEVFRFAGRAVVITSLTTMVGFGSMMFASYRGLWTAGVFALLGVGICLLSSVTLLPALLQAFVVAPEERRLMAAQRRAGEEDVAGQPG